MKLKKLNYQDELRDKETWGKSPREEQRYKNKKDVFVKKALDAIILKVSSSTAIEENIFGKGTNWQNLNENQRQFKSIRLVKSLYSGNSRFFMKPINQLETRLDILVFRWNLAVSLSEARELINKGFIKVNSALIKFPGHQVSEIGSLIQSTSALRSLKARLIQKDNPLPSYLFSPSFSPLSGILILKPIYDSTIEHGPLKIYQRSFAGAAARS